MRTLIEIIEAAKDGNKPTHDECYFAMLAIDALSTFTTRDLRNVGFGTREAKLLSPKFLAEEDHKRWRRALNKPPDEWLGPNNIPGLGMTRMRVIWEHAPFGGGSIYLRDTFCPGMRYLSDEKKCPTCGRVDYTAEPLPIKTMEDGPENA
jgi:hypothetical protein